MTCRWPAVELKGTTSNVEDGQTVTLTVTDVNGKDATVTDGKFSTTVDLGASGLADGNREGGRLTRRATRRLRAGDPGQRQRGPAGHRPGGDW